MLEEQRQKSQQAFQKYRTDQAKVMNDRDLTDEGKRKRLGELETSYRREIGFIQDNALQELDRHRQRLTKEVAAARAKGVEAKRSVLGDVVYSTLLMRQMDTMGSGEIATWFAEASEGFEKTLVGEYGSALVKQRLNSVSPTAEDFGAAQTLTQAEPDDLRQAREGLRDVEVAESRLIEFDPAAHAESIGNRYGVNARLVSA